MKGNNPNNSWTNQLKNKKQQKGMLPPQFGSGKFNANRVGNRRPGARGK